MTTILWKPVESTLSAASGITYTACSSGSGVFNTGSSPASVDSVLVYGPAASSLRLYNNDGACTTEAANVNGYAVALMGGSFVNLPSKSWVAGETVDLTLATNLSRFIAVPYSSAATAAPSLTVSYRNGSSACSTGQIVITNAGGTVLTAASACGTGTTQTATATDSTSLGGSGQFYVFYTRVSDSAGALRIWSTSLTK